jgi:hypothetical protein
VTILCVEASMTGKTFNLRDPQVVNGLQTCREIFDFMTQRAAKPAQPDTRTVLVRIIVPQDERSRNRIIRATNNQNPIPVASLRSTDSIHRDIEEYLAANGWLYERRKNYYKNQGRPRGQIITIPYLSQSVAAIVLQRPSDARARPSSLLKDDADYRDIFSVGYSLGTFYNSILIMRRVEDYLRTADLSITASEKNDIKFHVATAVGAMLVNRAHPTAAQVAAAAVDTISDELLKRASGIVLNSVSSLKPSLGDDMDRIAKSPQMQRAIVDGVAAAVTEDLTLQ